MGFVDLHSHVLPGLDDGPSELGESLELLAGLRELGFETVHATPHQRTGLFMPSLEAIDEACTAVQGALPEGSVALGLGAENMWDEVFLARSLERTIPGYRSAPAAGSVESAPRAFLFEIPVAPMTPPGLDDRLFTIRRGGPLPVMAHPERYTPLWDDRSRYEALAQRVALVIDLAALDGTHGAKQCKAARWLVEQRLAHGAASDCHSAADLPGVAAGIAWIRKRMGEAETARLLDTGPRQILNGELPG